MQSFCDAFRRNADGSWLCLERATIQGPGARIDASLGETYRRGTRQGGLDLAEFLDIEESVRLETRARLGRLRTRLSSLPAAAPG